MVMRRAIVRLVSIAGAGLLAVTLAGTGGAAAAADPGPVVTKGEEASPRIIAGRPPAAGDFGFMVALARNDALQAQGLYQAQFCGGSLVAPTLVVTAAHCVTDDNGNLDPVANLVVAWTPSGVLSDPAARIVPAANVVVHPSWTPSNFRNDVAVVVLAAPLDGVPVARVSSPEEAAPIVVGGAPAWSAGWGLVQEGTSNAPDAFLVADLTVFPTNACSGTDLYTLGPAIFQGLGSRVDSTIMMCAGGVNALGVTDTCQGDSGGPLLAGTGPASRLVGVVSWGDGCGRATPGVYTRLSAYRDWLVAQGVPVTLAPRDRVAPRTTIAPAVGLRGTIVRLRFTSSESSRRTKEVIYIRSPRVRVVSTLRSRYAPTLPNRWYYYNYRLPKTPGFWSWCLVSIDPSGNKSALRCARLTVR